jgi:spore maturation protein CgeB
MRSELKVLVCHGYSVHHGDYNRIRNWIERLNSAGFHVDDFYIGMNIRGMRMPFIDLDFKWKSGNLQLLHTYEQLAIKALGFDVLINFGGVNLHPEFLQQLNTINVLRFNDDPEASSQFSQPIATGHDYCAIGNIAEVETYRRWGVQNVHWVPLGFWYDDYNPALTVDHILSQDRHNDIALMCERITPYRRAFVDQYSLVFPTGTYRGKGWPDGFLPEEHRIPLLQATKIGINIHNSTGPINYRTYYLPANGVLQICDNKAHLGKIFELGKEVVGYDSINEAIELTRYYLNNEDERRAIALAGFERAIVDYNEVACFQKMLDPIKVIPPRERGRDAINFLTKYKSKNKLMFKFYLPVFLLKRYSSRFWNGGLRRLDLYLATLKMKLAKHLRNGH